MSKTEKPVIDFDEPDPIDESHALADPSLDDEEGPQDDDQ